MTRTVWISTWIVQIARIVSGIVIRIVRIVIFMFMIVHDQNGCQDAQDSQHD